MASLFSAPRSFDRAVAAEAPRRADEPALQIRWPEAWQGYAEGDAPRPDAYWQIARAQQEASSRRRPGPPREGAPSQDIPPMEEILRAVESLHRDQLKPFGRIIRKRLAERAEELGAADLDVGLQGLRLVCEACPWLLVQNAEGAEWTACLVGRPTDFVDAHSPEDVYPAELWDQVAVYFESLEGEEMVLPGGRYMCARKLAEENLAFLKGYSLGQIAHIVQLAISQKRLLGYSAGTLVPYAHSQSMLKDKHAQCQLPVPGNSPGKTTVTSWEALREHLLMLMKALGPQAQRIPLSNIKRLFRTRFSIELSETALGYAKLSELLQDRRLGDLCEVRREGYGYVLLPAPGCTLRTFGEGLRMELARQLSEGAQPEAKTRPRAAPSPQAAASHGSQEAPRRATRPWPLCMDEVASAPSSPDGEAPVLGDGSSSSAEAARPPPGLVGGAPTYGLSLPRLLGAVRTAPPGLERERAKEEAPAGRGRKGSGEPAPGSGRAHRAGAIQQLWALPSVAPGALDGLDGGDAQARRSPQHQVVARVLQRGSAF